MRRTLATLVLLVALTGCGAENIKGSPDPATEAGDSAAAPPAGWRTVTEPRAGVSFSAPRSWRVERGPARVVVRAPDRSVAVTVTADRTAAGRRTPPERYAALVLERLPGFGDAGSGGGELVGSPYATARLDATSLAGSAQRRATVAAFHRSGRVTATAVVFAGLIGSEVARADEIERLLESVRLQRPDLRGKPGGSV